MVKDERQRELFIEQNLGLVHTICRRFAGKGIEYEDLYQSGCMGLVKAYDAFDEDRGLMFSTYAVPVIMGCVRRLFRDGGAVKVSRGIKELGIKVNREKIRFEQKYGVEPTVNQLAEVLSVEAEDITEALCAMQSTVSLTFRADDGLKEADLPDIENENIDDRIEVQEAIKTLNKTEQDVIKYRYFYQYTQSKTAGLLGLSQVQVSRTEKKALGKLRLVLK